MKLKILLVSIFIILFSVFSNVYASENYFRYETKPVSIVSGYDSIKSIIVCINGTKYLYTYSEGHDFKINLHSVSQMQDKSGFTEVCK